MPRTMSAQQARDNFGELIGSVHFSKVPVVIEKRGKPYAVVISPEDFAEWAEYRVARAWEAIDRIREANADLDPDQLYAEITAAVEEVRRERWEASGGASLARSGS